MPKTPAEKRAYAREYARKKYAENPEMYRAKTAAWRAENPEKATASDAAQYAKNRDKVIARVTASHKANPEKVKAYNNAYYCGNHERELARAVTYRAENPDKIKAANAANYAANPEKSLEATRQFRHKNPEKIQEYKARGRARKANAPVCDFTRTEWREMKEAYGHCCVYCGRHMERLTQDHLVPLIKNGSHTKSNIVPACQSCNSKKNAGPPLPFALELLPSVILPALPSTSTPSAAAD